MAKQPELRRAYEAKDTAEIMRILRKQSSEAEEFARNVELDLDVNPKKLASITDANLAGIFPFLKKPFKGKFHFYIDGEDVVPLGERGSYPFAYAEWLIDNFWGYSEERIYGKNNGEMQSHVLAYECGDYSPDIFLFREGDSELVIPTFWKNPRRVSVQAFKQAVRGFSNKALSLLEQNPNLKGSHRVKSLKKGLSGLR